MKERLKTNKGAVLPIVLLVVVVTQITFYAVIQVYQSQMETYQLLINHYQSQTILSLTENELRKNPTIGTTFNFNIGTVRVEGLDEETVKLKSQLHSGYYEEAIVKKEIKKD